jgi:hypothetical protein
MQAILKFKLPEENSEFEMACNAGKMHSALWEIAQEVFRPHRKHGYSNPELNKLCEENDQVLEAISILETMFYRILEDNQVNLD